MLVLSRKQGERVIIGGNIVVTVIEGKEGRVRLGFEAPQGTPIHREEVFERIARTSGEAPDGHDRGESRYYAQCG
jgi:carbon storage regulator